MLVNNMRSFAVPQTCEVPKGAYGIWQIPEQNVLIPLYKAPRNAIGQKVIDAENSAAFEPYGCANMIIDHADSISNDGKGIWQIGELHPDSMAFLTLANGKTKSYKCALVAHVSVKGSAYLLDGMAMYPNKATDIVCVCCVGSNSNENYWALFKYKGEMP